VCGNAASKINAAISKTFTGAYLEHETMFVHRDNYFDFLR